MFHTMHGIELIRRRTLDRAGMFFIMFSMKPLTAPQTTAGWPYQNAARPKTRNRPPNQQPSQQPNQPSKPWCKMPFAVAAAKKNKTTLPLQKGRGREAYLRLILRGLSVKILRLPAY